jgi:hypothetical protein
MCVRERVDVQRVCVCTSYDMYIHSVCIYMTLLNQLSEYSQNLLMTAFDKLDTKVGRVCVV